MQELYFLLKNLKLRNHFFCTDIDVYNSTVLFKRKAQFANCEAGTIICISLPLSSEQWDEIFYEGVYSKSQTTDAQ